MRQHFLSAVILSLLGMSCTQPDSLRQFGDVSVSDPEISGFFLHVDVVNNTGEALCYFEDGLFYGPSSTDGSTGQTELLRPAIGNSTLEEIKLSRTNRRDFKLVRLPEGGGEVSIKITGQDPLVVGDDLSFDLVFCDPEPDGLHRSLVYSSRLQ